MADLVGALTQAQLDAASFRSLSIVDPDTMTRRTLLEIVTEGNTVALEDPDSNPLHATVAQLDRGRWIDRINA